VEDEEAIRRMLGIALAKTYDVKAAADGPTGLALAEEFAPELLMLDVMLPGMTGFEVAKAIRALPGQESTPFLFLTAKDDPASMAQGVFAGARHYVTKPFKVREVLILVERIFRLRDSLAPQPPSKPLA
jgi:two-component system, OmpR family, response regulator